MKQTVTFGLVVLGLGVSAFGQKTPEPEFAQYFSRVEKVTARSIDFKNSPDATTYRTRLTEALRRGVNFAGHYILTGWGCGTGCTSGAIIDARTGHVYFPDPLGGMGTAMKDDGNYVDEPVRYRKNSRLLIISGVPATHPEGRAELPTGVYYYEWIKNRLRLIRSVPQKSGN